MVVSNLNTGNFCRKYWGEMMKESHAELKKMNMISVRWIRRSSNQTAQHIARWVGSEPNKDWTQYFPICIITHIQKDMSFIVSQ